MAVTIVNSGIVTQAGGSWAGTIPAATIGNSLILLADAATDPGSVASSAPLYNSLPVTGATKLWDISQGATGTVGCAGWLLPNIPTSSTALQLTYTGGQNFGAGATGLWYYEVNGLGASPTVITPVADVGGTASPIASGSTGPATGPGIAVGCMVAFGQVVTMSGGGGWSALAQMSDDFGVAAAQLLSSGSVNLQGTFTPAANWAAGAAIILATAGAAVATPSPIIGPSLAAIRAASW
jgi:hypothetical protein